MGGIEEAGPARADAALAACIMAVDPQAIGGICVRSRAGPERDRFMTLLRGLMPPRAPFRRLPATIGDARLLGGLDLAATLQARRPVLERGLLAETDGGILVAAMAERLPQALAARLAAVLDCGAVTVERDGFGVVHASRIAVVALDEGLSDDERPPQALLDRLAIHIDLVSADERAFQPPFSGVQIETARQTAAAITVSDDIRRAICGVAADFGIEAIRATMLALTVARLHAALMGRRAAVEEDAVVAARLVLLPRATSLPVPEFDAGDEENRSEDDGESAADHSDHDRHDDHDEQVSTEVGTLAEVVLAAVAAAMPPGLLAKLQAGGAARARTATSGRAGAARSTALRGRPVGARRGDMRAGVRLNLVETLRTAAPWQAMRRLETGVAEGRVMVRREDFRIVRYKHRSETATIFLVDASGSTAMHRLAEAKGAVELLLADCYIRRDHVALISFRGRLADLILPPTRSLTRAKRMLAALPGGGGTPLAAAIDAGLGLADTLRRRGLSPTLVFLTDGRANVGRGAAQGREQAQDDAYAAARHCRAARLSSLVVDTSPQPGPAAARLASEIGGRYLPLPYADAAAISQAIRTVAPSSDRVVAH